MADYTITTVPDDKLRMSQHVASSEDAETHSRIDVSTTLGLGGSLLVLRVEQAGEHRQESVDLQEFLNAWATRLREEING